MIWADFCFWFLFLFWLCSVRLHTIFTSEQDKPCIDEEANFKEWEGGVSASRMIEAPLNASEQWNALGDRWDREAAVDTVWDTHFLRWLSHFENNLWNAARLYFDFSNFCASFTNNGLQWALLRRIHNWKILNRLGSATAHIQSGYQTKQELLSLRAKHNSANSPFTV